MSEKKSACLLTTSFSNIPILAFIDRTCKPCKLMETIALVNAALY